MLCVEQRMLFSNTIQAKILHLSALHYDIIVVNIDQDQMKLVLVNITYQEKQISVDENRITWKLL